ncbi:gephyrin: PROVISIONAL [Gigaspora margarita]|uniref:Gephyrin: PROVISIONAL n=1 Tax=Gigaspora margarita TaxID=4874 RepID=A0A8H3X3V1_GIGMA|nr:gephyrin: PROVISIONAL [Gigaspora margarita]
MWLKQGCDCGHFCFGIDRKYNLNNEKAPVLAMVIKDQASYGSLLAFESGLAITISDSTCLQNHGLKQSNEEAAKIEEYNNFINFLPLDNNIKDNLICDLKINCICDEWWQSFIDGEWMPKSMT